MGKDCMKNETSITQYNVIWESPSIDETGQMPIGNGDMAAGVYAIEEGALYLLLAKNDAYTYCGDLFKTGRVKVEIKPSPFKKGGKFIQTLDLETGSIKIETETVTIRVWANMKAPLFHVEVEGQEELNVKVEPEFWKRMDRNTANQMKVEVEVEPTQDVCVWKEDHVVWYYPVGDRSIYQGDLEYYDIPYMDKQFPDPFCFNTFGNLLTCGQMDKVGESLVGKGTYFDIQIYGLTLQNEDPNVFIHTIEALAKESHSVKEEWEEHCKWWAEFWGKSYIYLFDNRVEEGKRGVLSGEHIDGERMDADTGALIGQSYMVFRFMMACQSRNKVQTKFNGGLFTQPLYDTKPSIHCPDRPQKNGHYITHEDERLWGRRFTFQNQRLLYWPLLMSGDYEMILPFFHYYRDMLEVRKAITKEWFGHEGAYFRENLEPTGAERDCSEDGKPLKTKPGENDGSGYYHSYYFTCSLELVTMMLEYAKYTGDEDFIENMLLPVAREVITFFDQHYERDEKGRLKIDPAMVLETWWIAVNPAPDVAGLIYSLGELIKMDIGTEEEKKQWAALFAILPEVALEEVEGKKYIAPAEKYDMRKNSENGELYPIFPFRLYGICNGNLDIAQETMDRRSYKNSYQSRCWTQDQIHYAYVGDAIEAAEGLERRFRAASEQCRFPIYGRANPDSCPDFDHFGSGSTALQRMLVQESEDKIVLFPAWPKYWDVSFKLCLEEGVVVSGEIKDGVVKEYNVTSTKKEVICNY